MKINSSKLTIGLVFILIGVYFIFGFNLPNALWIGLFTVLSISSLYKKRYLLALVFFLIDVNFINIAFEFAWPLKYIVAIGFISVGTFMILGKK